MQNMAGALLVSVLEDPTGEPNGYPGAGLRGGYAGLSQISLAVRLCE